MLELNIRNLDDFDLQSLPEEDVKIFGSLEVGDLKVDGRLYPIGIKHSKERAEKIGKVLQIIKVGAETFPQHIAMFRAAQVLSEEMNLDEDSIVEFGIGLVEAQDLQKLQAALNQKEQARNPDAPTQATPGQGGGQPA